MVDDAKHDARGFLDGLADAIAREAPRGTAMERTIRTIAKAAQIDPKEKHRRLPEAAFLNTFVLPVLKNEVMAFAGLDAAAAQAAILNEYHRSMPGSAAGSPIRATRHPFKKVLGVSAESIYRGWLDPREGFGLTQSAPDFSLKAPFPHRILFEGKYFSKGSREVAQRELVRDIYQAFFYRGLPKTAQTKRHPEWDYDYACLLAFDASPSGALKKAWEALDSLVRKSFWEGAHLYVMILGGEGEVRDE